MAQNERDSLRGLADNVRRATAADLDVFKNELLTAINDNAARQTAALNAHAAENTAAFERLTQALNENAAQLTAALNAHAAENTAAFDRLTAILDRLDASVATTNAFMAHSTMRAENLVASALPHTPLVGVDGAALVVNGGPVTRHMLEHGKVATLNAINDVVDAPAYPRHGLDAKRRVLLTFLGLPVYYPTDCRLRSNFHEQPRTFKLLEDLELCISFYLREIGSQQYGRKQTRVVEPVAADAVLEREEDVFADDTEEDEFVESTPRMERL